jgi:hypothetical protein
VNAVVLCSSIARIVPRDTGIVTLLGDGVSRRKMEKEASRTGTDSAAAQQWERVPQMG